MLRVDLSVLSRAELRRLLAQARLRGQTGLAEQLQGELDARGSGGAMRQVPKPAPEDDEPGPMLVPDEPLVAPENLHLELARRSAPPRRRSFGPAAAAMVAAFGVAFGWGFLGAPGLPRREPAAPGPMAASPPFAPVAAPAPPRAEVARLAPPVAATDASPQARPPEPAREAKPDALVGTAVDAVSRPRRLDPCAAPPTPADRLLCHDLALNLLERELRDAYGRALDAGADAGTLRADQAAWRAERDPVSDPQVLARLYDRRIRDLKAQTDASARDRQ